MREYEWIPVTKDLPVKRAVSSKKKYLVTVTYSDMNKPVVTDASFGRISTRWLEGDSGKNYRKYIHDGWAFGILMNNNRIGYVINADAWMEAPDPYMGK